MAEAKPTSLYRYFDGDGILLYVGITSRGDRRNREHNSTKHWWRFVNRQEVEHFEDRATALAVERDLIIAFQPPFNIQHNPNHEDTRAVYEALRGSGFNSLDPKVIKHRGRAIELRATGGTYKAGDRWRLRRYASHLRDSPLVLALQTSKQAIRAGGAGTSANAKLWTDGGILFARVSSHAELPSVATARFKYVTQKPLALKVSSFEAKTGGAY